MGGDPRGSRTSGGFFDRSPELSFFQSLEAVMIKRRGAPLQLSPDDWHISKAWLEAGIPLDLIDETIESVIEKRRTKELEIPRRLSFYRQAVEVSWKRVGALTAPGARREAPAFDLESRLGNLAAVLQRVASRCPSVASFPGRVLETASGGDVAAVEATLEAIDGECLRAAEAGLEAEAAARLRTQVQDALLAHADLSPEPPSPKVERRLHTEALRRTLGLPVLSLFSPEAAREEGEPPSTP